MGFLIYSPVPLLASSASVTTVEKQLVLTEKMVRVRINKKDGCSCVLHQEELMQNWELAKDDLPLNKIAPLM